MQWLSDLFPFGDNKVLQIAVLVACGIAVLVVLAIVYRLAFAHRLRVPGGRTRQPRLGLVDAFSLDGQRQLVLIRRDNVEHLVMIGGPNDVLVESQINRALAPAREGNHVAAAAAPARRAESEAAPAPQPAPRPVVAQHPVGAPPPAAPPAAAPVPPRQMRPSGPIAPPPPVAAQPAEAAPVRVSEPAAVTPPSGATVQPATAVQASARPAPADAPRPSTVSVTRSNAPLAPVTPKAVDTAAPSVSSMSQSRPLPARQTMPAPIVPVQRGDAQSSDKQHPAPAVLPPKPLTPGPVPRADSAPSSPGRPPEANSVKEPPPVIYVAPNASTPTVRTEAKLEKLTPLSPEPMANVRRAGEPAAAPKNVGDPFADLETLEAEMARLLGRDKLT